jgi:histone H3/H4
MRWLQARLGIQSGVAAECLASGCHAADEVVIACLTDVACQFLTALARTAAECAAHHGRTDANIDDVAVSAIAVHGNPNAAADIAAFAARHAAR